MDKTTEAKPWRCGSGHVLGMARRNGSGITQLSLYRQAVDFDASDPAEVDVIAVVEGMVLDVRCSICGRMRTWVPGAEALRKLLASVTAGRE